MTVMVESQEDKRMVVTLSAAAAKSVRAMSAQTGLRSPELVRRGLSLLRVWLSLGDGEDMMIRRADGSLERLVPPV